MQPPEIIINGYFGYGNLGDEAILRSETANLKSISPDLKITVLAKAPQNCKYPKDICVVSRYNIIQIASKLKKGAVYITGGGGILQDKTSTKSLIYYTSLIHLAAFRHAVPVIFANGIGPVTSNIGKRILKKAVSRCRYISLRDAGSKDLLEKLLPEKKEIFITSDQVFTVSPCDTSKALDVLSKHNIPQNFIAISVRGNASIAYKDSFAESIIKIAVKENATPVFFPMQASEDLETCLSLAMRTNGKVVSGIDEKELTGILPLSKFAIGMRLHFVILCILSGKPIVAIPYDEKVSNMLDHIDCMECLASQDELYQKYIYIKNNEKSITMKFKKQAKIQKQKALEDINSLILSINQL